MSGGDLFPLREAARRKGHIPSVYWDIFNNLLTMYLLHLTYNGMVLSLDGVITSFIVPEVSVLSEQSEWHKVGREIRAEGNVLEAYYYHSSVQLRDSYDMVSVSEYRDFSIPGDNEMMVRGFSEVNEVWEVVWDVDCGPWVKNSW